MATLSPLETLYEKIYENKFPLPSELEKLYGQLYYPRVQGRPHLIGNLVTTLDGVVAFNVPGHNGGGDISGHNQHDHMVMGLLRACADAIIVGAGTLRASPGHLWTAEYIYPSLAHAYQQLRSSLGKTIPPLNVIVTAQGNIDLNEPVFQSGEVPVLVVTTAIGEQQLRGEQLPPSVRLAVAQSKGTLSAQSIVGAVNQVQPCNLILTEGGPHLLGDFLAERQLDELFLTLAPQIAGRDESTGRPGLVAGKLFAPEHPVWGTLVSVKRAENHLFLRYAFP